jgi:hypothetical protein
MLLRGRFGGGTALEGEEAGVCRIVEKKRKKSCEEGGAPADAECGKLVCKNN